MAKAPAKTSKKKSFKKKEKKSVPHGIVHVQATFNNTIVTIADPLGNVVSWSSAGSLGFRGSRKGTPFAAQQASLTAATKAKEQANMRTVEVRVAGPGSGRESAVRALGSVGLDVKHIKDTTPIPHNGCRPPKKRRV
ncbi:MAG: 30S ribosomal protein S11 [Bryobacter sp.]|jgi:small subunit ribosomal protein S11|nr:30S ribosomal protein S11 [Bryobacter sp.]